MRKLMIMLFVIFTITATAQSSQKYISVTGTAERTLPADQIEFSIQIETIDETVMKSKSDNDKSLEHLLEILEETKIDTNYLNVSPIMIGKNYEQKSGERIQSGFYARVSVSFILKDLSKYYNLTDKIASIDNFEIIDANYAISDYEAENKETYIEALKAARTKAEYMAETMGVKILGVLEISDTDMGQPFVVNAMRAKISVSGSVSGKVELSRSVSVKFAID